MRPVCRRPHAACLHSEWGNTVIGKQWRAALVACLAVSSLATACGSSSDSAASVGGHPGPTKLTVGIPANSAASAFLQLAVEAGLTKDEGLDVKLNSSLPPANTPAALVSDSIQASTLTSAASLAHAKGIPVVNVLTTAAHAPFVLLAGPGIESTGQLAGKSVVTSAATDTPGTETTHILSKAGVLDKTKVISVGTVPGRSALFVSKKADAIYEALNLALKDEAKVPGSKIIDDNSSLEATPADGLTFAESYLKDHRDDAVALVKASLRAANMIKNEPTKAAPYLKKIYSLNDDEVAQYLKYQKDAIFITGQPQQGWLDNQAKLFGEQPSTGKKVDWTAQEVAKSWDTSLASEATKSLGYH